MAAKQVIKIQGLKVALYEKSFRIDGCAHTVFLQVDITEPLVRAIVEPIYLTIFAAAVEAAHHTVAEDAAEAARRNVHRLLNN